MIEPAPIPGPASSLEPEPVLLILADISGYTRYMTANAKTLAHSQTIITELVHAIVQQIEAPLTVAKLEGDAIFLYCRKQATAKPWPEIRRMVGEKLLSFFELFQHKLKELSLSATCSCSACAHIDQLKLKLIVHSGEALFHRVLNFEELAGVDVIIAHRLLKNSVPANQYLLITEPARHDIEFSYELPLTASREDYEDIGKVETFVFLPPGAAFIQPTTSLARRFGISWSLFRKLWFAPLARHSANGPGKFRNLASNSTTTGRAAFRLFTLLLTPLFLPAGALIAFIRAWRRP